MLKARAYRAARLHRESLYRMREDQFDSRLFSDLLFGYRVIHKTINYRTIWVTHKDFQQIRRYLHTDAKDVIAENKIKEHIPELFNGDMSVNAHFLLKISRSKFANEAIKAAIATRYHNLQYPLDSPPY